jgi:hypothetical protein
MKTQVIMLLARRYADNINQIIDTLSATDLEQQMPAQAFDFICQSNVDCASL